MSTALISNVIQRTAGARTTFDVTTTRKGKATRINCIADNGELLAKPADGNTWVRVCDLRLPLSDKKLMPLLRRTVARHFMPAAETLDDLYFIAARQIEDIAEANEFKALDTYAIWTQRGETIGCHYDLYIDEAGNPGIADRDGIWQHIQEITKRSPVFDANTYKPAVSNEGLDDIKAMLVEFANRAKTFSTNQQALFA